MGNNLVAIDSHFPISDLQSYWDEFVSNGERCNVLWQLETLSVDELLREYDSDKRTTRYAFIVGGKMVGALRLSKRINFPANGHIGVSVRPSERGEGYAPIMIHMALSICRMNGIKPTACIDRKNQRSIKAFQKAGFVPSGVVYDWTPNPLPRTALEFIPKEQ